MIWPIPQAPIKNKIYSLYELNPYLSTSGFDLHFVYGKVLNFMWIDKGFETVVARVSIGLMKIWDTRIKTFLSLRCFILE